MLLPVATQTPARQGARIMNRVRADIWVQALLRRCAGEGVPAFVVSHGDDSSGTVLVKVNMLDGRAVVYSPMTDMNGGRSWTRGTGAEPVPDSAVEAYIEKEKRRDPDLWVIEIEDRDGRSFLTEPVLDGA